MAGEVRVMRQTTEHLFDEAGRPVEHIRVEFKVGEDGPFYRRFPVEGYSAYAVKAALDAFANELRTVRGS